MSKKRRVKTRKNEKKVEVESNSVGNIKTKFWAVIGIICFLLLFYLLAVYITTKNSEPTDSDTQDENVETAISYTTTIVGRSLSMKDGDYLVLFYDASDDDLSSTYGGLVSNYAGELSIYTVDMSSSFNKTYVTSEESNRNPESESDFKINGPTLIRVSDHKVAEYIEGEESITSYLS